MVDLLREHLYDYRDSYLKKLLRDHDPSVVQNSRRLNTLQHYRKYFSKWKRMTEKFEEVKPLPAKNKMWVFTYST